MNGPTTARRPADDAPLRLYRRLSIWHLVAAAAGVAAMLLLGRLMEQPTFIDEISIDNPTRYDIRIQVTGGDRDGWMTIGTARRDSTSTFEQIVDHGDVWIFRFTAQLEDGGELRLKRTALESAGWRFEIPESVGDELQTHGAPFPP